MVEKCGKCQQLRQSQHAEPRIVTTASRPMEAVSVDLFQVGSKHYIVMVDRFSGYPLVSQLRILDTKSVVQTLQRSFMLFGVPLTVRSDGGPQFRAEFEKFCTASGIRHEKTSPYHSESNGHAESAVKSMKYLLLKVDCDWTAFERALLEWRNTPRADDNISPAQLFFGRRQRTFLPTHPSAYATTHTENIIRVARSPGDGKLLRKLSPGEAVFIQCPHTKRWTKQGVVSGMRPNGRSYFVEDEDGRRFLRNRRFLRRISSDKTSHDDGIVVDEA